MKGQVALFLVFIHDLPIILGKFMNEVGNKRYHVQLFSDLIHWRLFSEFNVDTMIVKNFKSH